MLANTAPPRARSRTTGYADPLARWPTGSLPLRPPGASSRPSKGVRFRDGASIVVFVLGLLASVVVFLPAEGRIATPLHDAIVRLLGRASFLLPIALLVTGGIGLARGLMPERPLPLLRLTGACMLGVVLIPSVHLIGLGAGESLARVDSGEGGGLLGHWIGTRLLHWFGGPATTVSLLGMGALGLLFLLDLTLAETAAAAQAVIDRAAPHARRLRSVVGPPRLPHLQLPRVGPLLARIAARVPRLPRLVTREGTYRAGARPGLRLPRTAPAVAPVAAEWRGTSVRTAEPRVELAPEATSEAGGASTVVEPAVIMHPQQAPLPLETVAAPSEIVEVTTPRFSRDEALPDSTPLTRVNESPVAASLLSADPDTWRLPNLSLFRERSVEQLGASALKERAAVIEETLASFSLVARVVAINQGPAVTQFGLEPADGVAVNKILARQNDLALRLGVSPIRLEAPVPGKNMVGIEVPNGSISTVTIRDVLESPEWQASSGALRLVLGRDVSGSALVGDLARMPHLLIAGATGSGKSVCINSIVGSLLWQFSPDELQLVLVDPKRVELAAFASVPHLRLPVVAEMERVVGTLRWVVLEMERRYRLFSERGARNLEAYNGWAEQAQAPDEPRLPYLVVLIDELADMMMTASDEVEKLLCRLAQLARATGIHLVVATQRPSVDVLTGLIKANFPTRMAFAVSSQTDSRVILDQAGAEKLLGRGDALFMPTDAMKPIRLQGALVTDEEIQSLVEHWSGQGRPRYSPEDLELIESLGRGDDGDEADDEDVYEQAVEIAEATGRVSASTLQRRLGIGKTRAARIVERLAEEGVIEESNY